MIRGWLSSRTDLPLKGDAASRFLPWVVAVMVYLAVLALAGALLARDSVLRWSRSLTGTLTVQIAVPAGERNLDVAMADRIDRTLELLRRTPGIDRAQALSADQISALLEPWLGGGAIVDELPLPALIDVALVPGARVDLKALAERLAAAVPGAALDDHGKWLKDLIRLALAAQAAAGLILLLVTGCAVAAVVFAVRTSLAIHRDVVEILHLVGARDRYIASQFQRHALALSLKGGLSGWLLALITLGGAAWALLSLDAALMPRPSLAWLEWLLILLPPFAATGIAVLTARLAVHNVLGRMI
ncbi:MAG: cell division protein [Alphaproteobacteria bacterium]|nr:cell division protein [Alphaproteobacteria bacterium]